RRLVESQHRRKVQVLVLRNEVDAAWNRKNEVFPKDVCQFRVLGVDLLPTQVGRAFDMTTSSVELRLRECLGNSARVNGVKRVQIEDSFDSSTTHGLCQYLSQRFAAQSVAIKQNE